MPITSVRVGAVDYPIRYMSAAHIAAEDLFGVFMPHRYILINPNQAPSIMASTIIHECIHAIFEGNGIKTPLSEEDACSVLEGPLVAFIRDNPALIKAILAAGKKGTEIKLAPAVDD